MFIQRISNQLVRLVVRCMGHAVSLVYTTVKITNMLYFDEISSPKALLQFQSITDLNEIIVEFDVFN